VAPDDRSLVAVQRLYDAWIAGDTETALAGIHPDIEWIEPPDTPDGQTWRGPEGIVASMEEWTQPFDEFRFEIVERLDLGDQALFGLVQHARGKSSGIDVASDVWHLWKVQDGKATRLEMFRTKAEALAAAGAPGHTRPSEHSGTDARGDTSG
jgi:ketosteroid isomerase-like protein